MSRWGKPTKNTKYRDPRYFLNENIELDETELEEIQEGVPLSQSGGAREGELTGHLRGRVAAKNIQELNSNIEALERRMTKIENMLENMMVRAKG